MENQNGIDNEDKVILRQILEITKDNQEKIHRLYRNMWFSRVWGVMYWVIVIGIAVGAFYFLQPYLEDLKGVYSGFEGKVDSVRGVFQ